MRRWRKWITSQVSTGLCAFCTNGVFLFLRSPHPQLLVAMFLALVQWLFKVRFSRELAWISIDGTMRRRRKWISSQVPTGLCAFCTNGVFAFLSSPHPQLLVAMFLALVQRLFRARVSRELAWISIDGTMHRCKELITSQDPTGLCDFCTNSVFSFLNSPHRQFLVAMLLALVQRLFLARVSRELARISIDVTIRRCKKLFISQVPTGLCAFCTNSMFTFLNFPHHKLLVAMLLALVQRLFRARFSCELAWISIDGTMRRWKKWISSQVPTCLCAFCTNGVFTFLRSPHPQLLVAMLLALVQRLFRARVSRELAWISIDGTMRLWRKFFISQVPTGLCAFCTNSMFTFLNFPHHKLLVAMLLALVQRLFRARFSRELAWIFIDVQALCAVGGNGLVRRSLPVCALFAQTQCLHFWTSHTLSFL